MPTENIKEWIKNHLLDKNGYPSRLKKKKYLTAQKLEEMRNSCDYVGKDINCLIRFILLDLKQKYCECGNPIINVYTNKKQPMFCSVDCLNKSNFMKETVSKQQRKAIKEKGISIIEKRKKTNLERYGVEYQLQRKDLKEGVIEKANASKAISYEKRKQDFIEKHGMNLQQKQSNWDKETVRKINDEVYMKKLFFDEEQPLDIMAKNIGCSPSSVSNKIKEFGWERKKSYTYIEWEMLDFLLTLIPRDEIVVFDRKTFNNKFELDFYLPKYKLAIEMNGNYWHSTDKDEFYKHYNKFLACKENGITLMQFFEDEWNDKQDICKSIVKNKLGLSKRIFARKTVVQNIDTSTAKQFMEQNHISGYSRSKLKFGLFYDEELVSVMTLDKPRFDRNYDWEIIRYANKLEHQIVGGASKIFKCFVRNNLGTVMTYSNLRFGEGKVYEKMGFEYIKTTRPNYSWFFKKGRIPRYLTQKKKLPKLLGGNYNPELTEDQNMIKLGARKIFDAGNYKYVFCS